MSSSLTIHYSMLLMESKQKTTINYIYLFIFIHVRKLNQSYLDELGIHFMPGWKDPWGER